ncbi:MAG: hypothetical protein NT007_05930 [Candidatus Kapabacteria bacterium]|nr:hypothetical protein [Candidatus Kapabacteria bacterium]
MGDKGFNRTYSMSDANLCMFVSNLISFLTRNHTEFALYGVDAGDVTALETLGNASKI